MKTLFTFLVVILPFLSQAQEIPVDRTAKAIYVEALGSGLGLSINFDTRFQKGRLDGLGIRGGIGGISASASDGTTPTSIGVLSLPILVNYVVGNSRASFEAGGGLTLFRANASGTDAVNGDLSFQGTGVFGAFNLGLRLQPKRNGAHFRLYWNPIIADNRFQASWFGLSLGVGFK